METGAKREHQVLQTPTSSEPLTLQMLGAAEAGGTDPVIQKEKPRLWVTQ